MMESPDIKKKLLKQISEINAMLLEHGIKGKLSDIGPEMLEFSVTGNKPLTSLIKALYMREGVERVLVNNARGRSTVNYIQICLSSWT